MDGNVTNYINIVGSTPFRQRGIERERVFVRRHQERKIQLKGVYTLLNERQVLHVEDASISAPGAELSVVDAPAVLMDVVASFDASIFVRVTYLHEYKYIYDMNLI